MTQGNDFVRLARQLGVRVETPFIVKHDDEVLQFDAFLPDFGGPNGTVLLFDAPSAFAETSKMACGAGYYFSALNGAAQTSLRSVQETLKDLGYYGPASECPSWCTKTACS